MAKVGVIVSALAGAGQSNCFAKIKGREVFMRSLELFITRDEVCATIFAVGKDRLEQVKTKYGPHLAFVSVKVVGGADHFAAVAAAMEQIPSEADLVAIHDAARPAISTMQIEKVFAAAAESGAAMLAAQLQDTLREVGKDKKAGKTLKQTDLWVAQTPQVFSAKILRDAYGKREKLGKDFADDAELVAAAGTATTVVPSSLRNIRISSHDDLVLAGPIIDAIPKAQPKGPIGPYAEDKMW